MKRCVSILIFLPAFIFAQHADTIHIPPHLQYTSHQLIVPLSLSLMGVALNGNGHDSFKREIVDERNSHWMHFRTHADDILQFSPFIIAYGLDAAGVRSKTDLANRAVINLKGELIMLSAVEILKVTSRQLRPDSSSRTSFPSGHTAQAFAAATFLSEEYGQRYKWMPYVSYGLASTVGVLRMANNKHYISDVLLGAGLGILSMKVAYWTHQYKWGHHH